VVVDRNLGAADIGRPSVLHRLNELLDANDFDRFVEGLCGRFYATVMGRPRLTPGRYFRLLLLGYLARVLATLWVLLCALPRRSFGSGRRIDSSPSRATGFLHRSLEWSPSQR